MRLVPLAALMCLSAAAALAQEKEEQKQKPFTLGGYVETYYQWNFNVPLNGITNFRGFDNRHNSFTLATVALDAKWDYAAIIGRLTLQIGATPSTYYLNEPELPGSNGANATGRELWKYLQQAYVGYRFDVGRGLTVTAGLFLSAVGPETIPVFENWNWSRSNLFFGLPFYHTGIRVSHPLSSAWTVWLAGYNGWNSVVDNNTEKSLSAQVTFSGRKVDFSALYFGGVERPTGAPEGRAWRNLFDVFATWTATSWCSLRAHVDGGFEPNAFGVSFWTAAALSARFQLRERLFFAVRGDGFYERVAANSEGTASPIGFPVPWVASGTATLDYRPHERVSLRLEYRHDSAAGPLFFGREEAADRRAQNTVTLGATGWF